MRAARRARGGAAGAAAAGGDDDGGDDDDEMGDAADLLLNADADNEDAAAPPSAPASAIGADAAADADAPSLRDFMAAMDRELQGPQSTMRSSFARLAGGAGTGGGTGSAAAASAAPAAGGGLSPADEQYNLLASLAASVGGQAGAAGPASQLMTRSYSERSNPSSARGINGRYFW